MSKFSDFYNAMLKDEEVKKEAAGILGDISLVEIDKTQAELLVPIAKKLGFDITADEAINYLNADKLMLDENDLDAVAGGKGEDLHIYYDKDGKEYKREYR